MIPSGSYTELTIDRIPLRICGFSGIRMSNLKASSSMLHWRPRARSVAIGLCLGLKTWCLFLFPPPIWLTTQLGCCSPIWWVGILLCCTSPSGLMSAAQLHCGQWGQTIIYVKIMPYCMCHLCSCMLIVLNSSSQCKAGTTWGGNCSEGLLGPVQCLRLATIAEFFKERVPIQDSF